MGVKLGAIKEGKVFDFLTHHGINLRIIKQPHGGIEISYHGGHHIAIHKDDLENFKKVIVEAE